MSNILLCQYIYIYMYMVLYFIFVLDERIVISQTYQIRTRSKHHKHATRMKQINWHASKINTNVVNLKFVYIYQRLSSKIQNNQ